MNADQLQANILRRDIEHQAGTVLSLVERLEGRRAADKTTVQVLNDVAEGLNNIRTLLLTHLLGAGNKSSGGQQGVDEDASPF